jgi:cob(I)alamin adenosyltransferase
MKIYTRAGDTGLTSLFSGERVKKGDLRVEAYGTVDELNSVLGLAASFCQNPRITFQLEVLQNQLFAAGSDLATRTGSRRDIARIQSEDWEVFEKWIDELSTRLPALRNFVLPGGSAGSAFLQLGRAVCRRAERLAVQLQEKEQDVNPELIVFLNRLSDLLFTMARYENVAEGHEEVLWKTKES